MIARGLLSVCWSKIFELPPEKSKPTPAQLTSLSLYLSMLSNHKILTKTLDLKGGIVNKRKFCFKLIRKLRLNNQVAPIDSAY